MELTFINDLGQPFVVEIDPNMELENVMALLEAESGVPVAEQSISYEGRELSNPKATIRELGVQGNSAMLLLRRKGAPSTTRTRRRGPKQPRALCRASQTDAGAAVRCRAPATAGDRASEHGSIRC
ncbi:hypothetical protein FA13DRAFT_886528 [Coprinellus micaceus]|uniref:Ubiquitin-like domain-containing protein n=1 Tax=Coprinellus micaceus TaxID=71717 RepID=A0A4Y7TSB9_COPMI|nr:hypothetical protein FA13DRAFT_886528 [Coprinellus micaceus]